MATPNPNKLALDREFAVAAAAAAEMGGARAESAVGDVEGRRKGFDAMFNMIKKSMPDMPSVNVTKHIITSADGQEIVLTEFRKGSRPTTAGAAVYYIHGT